MIITVVAFLGVLAVLILAHEMGHFVTAKASGVTVEEFGLGFPPRLLSIRRGGTRYSLNAVPLGGFVKMAGEEDPGAPGSLASKSIGSRLLILSAGSLMNAILPVFLFSIAFMIPQDIVVGQVIVEQVSPGSPAAMAGIETGDTIISLDGKTVRNIGDLQRYISLNIGSEVPLQVKHADSTTENVQLTPRWRPPAGQGATGIVIRLSNPTVDRQHYPFWQAIPMGASKLVETFALFKNGIISMIIGSSPAAVAGPVGIAQITGEAARAGISSLLNFAAFLSLNLALINILPLPALDGGRIMFVLLEWVRRGRRIPPQIEGKIHFVGFAMLMALILLITYQDIMRIISGGSLIP